MSAAAKQPEAPAPRMEGSPPGPAMWCANCVHFRPGPIVVQGSTLGGCYVPQAGALPPGKIIEVTPREGGAGWPSALALGGPPYHQPRETLASGWCNKHKLRAGVLT
jgi:hypothetical protein